MLSQIYANNAPAALNPILYFSYPNAVSAAVENSAFKLASVIENSNTFAGIFEQLYTFTIPSGKSTFSSGTIWKGFISPRIAGATISAGCNLASSEIKRFKGACVTLNSPVEISEYAKP